MTRERLPAYLTALPPGEALAWAVREAAPGGKIVRLRRLRRGSSAALHALDIQTPSGVVLRLVLRRFVRERWLAEEPDLAEREARVLRLLEDAALSTPRLVALDEDGSECGVPAVLMMRLPGALDISPRDFGAWLRQLAEVLPLIHAVSSRDLTLVQPWSPYYDLREFRPPRWSHQQGAWERVAAVANRPRPEFEPAFIHRDYHPLNVLWRRGRVSGIVDWTNASVGPRDVDVGHCKTNLAVLYGPDIARRFGEEYERLSGRSHDPYWDVISLCDSGFSSADPSDPDGGGGLDQFYDAGATGLTVEAARQRLDDYVESLVRELG
jgi:aminoglycoside phosphotransferase